MDSPKIPFIAHGILELKPCADNTTYKQYILTEKGRRLFLLLVALRQWGEDYFCAEGEKHVVFIDSEKGEQVRRLELRAWDGRVLQPEDTLVSDHKQATD